MTFVSPTCILMLARSLGWWALCISVPPHGGLVARAAQEGRHRAAAHASGLGVGAVDFLHGLDQPLDDVAVRGGRVRGLLALDVAYLEAHAVLGGHLVAQLAHGGLHLVQVVRGQHAGVERGT